MTKNIKKLLVCILATLTITSFVFSCCKKIGLAASSDESPIEFNGLPYLIGPGIGYYDSIDRSFVLNCVDDAIQRAGSVASDHTIIGVPYNGHFAVMFLKTDSVNIDGSGNNFVLNYVVSYDYIINGGFNTYVSNASFTIQVFNVLETIDNHTFYKSSNAHYPVYLRYPQYFVNMSGTQIFADSDSEIPVIPDGHTKGGVLSNYVDSEDLLENSSDLPKVDTSAPSDSSSIPNWLQKILNGIGRVNQSIQGGILTIGDYIGSTAEKIGEWFQNTIDSIEGFFGRVLDKIDEVIDTIKGLADGSTVQMARDEWATQFENSIFQDFVDIRTTIEDDILTPIKNTNAPSSLSLTIPLIKVNVPRLISSGGQVSSTSNYIYLFGQSVTLDFSWYTQSISGGVFNGSSIRDFIVPVIATFLYVGMIVSLLFKIPSFLNGASGFTNLVHSGLDHNGQQFAPTSHGIFTTGVSSHQPSLDKNPISGGTFRFWNF